MFSRVSAWKFLGHCVCTINNKLSFVDDPIANAPETHWLLQSETRRSRRARAHNIVLERKDVGLASVAVAVADIIYYKLPATVRMVIALKNNRRPESAGSGKNHFAIRRLLRKIVPFWPVIELRETTTTTSWSTAVVAAASVIVESNYITLLLFIAFI